MRLSTEIGRDFPESLVEWAYGYDKRFGLVRVDYATPVRTIKSSGYRYAELIREHRAR